MKKLIFIAVIILFNSGLLFSQVSVNADGTAPHPSAGLDVNFTNKGFLLPRMTFEQRNAIQNPAEGLIVYCTNCTAEATGALSIYKDGVWRLFDLGCSKPNVPSAGTHVPSSTQIIWNWNTVPIAIGYKWNTVNIYGTALDLGSATTHTETSLTCWSNYTRYVWAYNSCGESFALTLNQSTLPVPLTPAPTEGNHASNSFMIAWTWNYVAGATGYKWGTTNNFSTATDMGNNILTFESGLACNTSYTRYVWAYNACGYSAATTLTFSTTPSPPDSPTAGTHDPSLTQIVWHWNTVNGASGYKWNTTNDSIGATDIGNTTSYTESGLPCNTPQTSYVWSYSICGVSPRTTLSMATLSSPPASPTADTHVATTTQIEWKWLTVSGATSYRWNTTNDSVGATDLGNVLSHTETGLPCNSSQTSYVWAVGPCGVSLKTTLTKATLPAPPASPTAGTHVAATIQIEWKWLTVSGATSYRWNTTNDSVGATDLGNVLSKTETGLTCNTPQTSYVWAVGPCGVSPSTTLSKATLPSPPSAPTAGTHVAATTQIEWKWLTVSGATSYRWNTTNDSVGATDLGNVLSYIETGLTCNSSQTSYVWAVGPCGVSPSTTLSKSTLPSPPASPTADVHVAATTQIEWKWLTVSGATSYRWNTTNDSVGATDLGNVLSHTETGLTCNSAQTSYVWAVGPCGVSPKTTLSKSTLPAPPASPTADVHIAATTQIEWKWLTVSGATSYRWNTTNDSVGATDLGNVLSHIETGLTCNSAQTSYVWAVGPCGVSPKTTLSKSTLPSPPASPTAGTHVAATTQIEWKWLTVSGATSYRWNTTNDSVGATDLGNVLFKIETGLTCNTPQTSYVWAVGPCGVSPSTTLSKSTLPAPPASPTADVHVAGTTQIEWKWLTVSGATSYRWNTTNDSVGATDLGNVLSKIETGLTCNSAQTSYVWAVGPCGVSPKTTLSKSTLPAPPASPTADAHVAGLTQIEWKWLTVSGATSYRWNTTNDSVGATDLGNVLSHTETSLTCNTPHTSYVWAVGSCGVSPKTTLSKATLASPPDIPVPGTHVAGPTQIEWKWYAVSGATSYKWHTSDDSLAATDFGNVLSHTETGLPCNTSQTRYVWAVGACGISASATLTAATTNEIPATPVTGTHVPAGSQIVWNWNPSSGAAGYKWNTVDVYSSATDMLTATSRTELSLHCDSAYTRYVWAYNGCGVSSSVALTDTTTNNPPAAPTAATHVPQYTQIEWKWNAVFDAIGYKWNTTNNYETATDMGTSTSKMETGLTCGSNYNRYAWAYNDCGNSTPVTLTQSLTCWTCGNSLYVNHVAGSVAPVNKSVTYGTVTNIPGETTHCWITSNLGSDHQATSSTDNTEASAGWYWQFNRMQGYKHDGTTRTPNTTWIYPIDESGGWSSANDPCTIELGTGWRIPTASEWTNVDASGGWGNPNGPWGSALKMHMAGWLADSNGALNFRGFNGAYWSTNQGLTNTAQNLYFFTGSCTVSIYPKAKGFTVRCLNP